MKNFPKGKDIAIVACGELKNERQSGWTAYELASQVMSQLLEKTSLRPCDINGLALTIPLSECSNPLVELHCRRLRA
ncbi:MAG: hypothetical protein ABSC37_13755 [Xanthobacteraceae bacterium]